VVEGKPFSEEMGAAFGLGPKAESQKVLRKIYGRENRTSDSDDLDGVGLETRHSLAHGDAPLQKYGQPCRRRLSRN